MSIGKCFIPRSIIQNCHFNLDFFQEQNSNSSTKKNIVITYHETDILDTLMAHESIINV